MKYIGKVIEIFSATKQESSLPRPIVGRLELIKGHGIKNDKFAQKDENKSVMLVGLHAYALANRNAIDIQYGSFGENILVDFDPHDFSKGTIFYIEDSQISIQSDCTVCDHLVRFDKHLPKIVKGKRGVYGKIEKGGVITKEMKVYIEEEK